MDNPEETAWVFDSLVGFLHGPVWNAPLQTFIEEKSLTFEPMENGEIPNRQEYVAIHEEYKNLVDLMLGSYMEDIGITPEQFEAACQMSREGGGLPLHFHQRLFEQIWAANDYSIFTRMMTQKNVELQIQALELIEQRSGTVPQSYLHDAPSEPTTDEQDAAIMEQVMKLSLEESEEHETALFEPIEKVVEPLGIEEIKEEKQTLISALDSFQKHITMKESEVVSKNIEEAEDKQDIGTVSVKDSFRRSLEPVVSEKPAKEAVEQRQLYLKQQRDKLLALKKQIREKQLAETDGDSSLMRPKSSKSARMVLSGNQITPQDSSLQLRKALADRLRSQVVEKS